MLNFATLFNQFRTSSNSTVSDLLQQPNIKLARLLDQDSFINEYKSGNARVIQFMKYDKISELVDYVVTVGPPEDKKRSHKFPLSACDMLSADNSTTIEFFFPEKPLTVTETAWEDVEVDVQVEIEDDTEEVKPEAAKEPQKVETAEQKQKTIIKDTLEIAAETNTPPVQAAKKEEEEEQVDHTNQIKSESQSQSQGMTPEKKKKKVMIKETRKVEMNYARQVPPLIGKLFSYFETEVNYTLAGYVCKILGVFLGKKPTDTLKYLLQPTCCEKMLNHAESRSVGELINKILTHESTQFLEQRSAFYKMILKKLSVNAQVHILSNVSSYVVELIQKVAANFKGTNKIPQFATIYFPIDVITLVIKNVMSQEENVSVYNAPVLFSYLTNVPFVLPEEQAVVDEFKKLLELFVEKSCEKLKVTNRSRPKLGIGRVKILQIIRFILKENILHSREIIAKRDEFFDILITLMKNYEMNNVLHNQIAKIIEISLSENEKSPLNIAVLKDDLLLNFIIQEATQDKKIRAGTSIYKTRKGYIAHIINTCLKINELSATNEALKKLSERPEYVSICQNFVEKEVFQNKKNLAGYAMRKDIKHEIMFQKDDIIAAYMTFLTKCPPSVYQPEPEHVNIEHPDLVEELQKQLEESLVIKDKTPEGVVEIKVEIEADTDDVRGERNFWVTHLNYDVDALLADL